MVKIRVLSKCHHCDGKAYLPIGEGFDFKGESYSRHIPCPVCEGSGLASKWVELPEFLLLLEQAKCSHQHTVSMGGFHLSEGTVWDDIREVCSACGEVLK
jgi:hypothetical protein